MFSVLPGGFTCSLVSWNFRFLTFQTTFCWLIAFKELRNPHLCRLRMQKYTLFSFPQHFFEIFFKLFFRRWLSVDCIHKSCETGVGEDLGNGVCAVRTTPFSKISTPLLRQNGKKSLILINFFSGIQTLKTIKKSDLWIFAENLQTDFLWSL